MKKNSMWILTKFHSFGSRDSFWNSKLYFGCWCLKYYFVLLCWEPKRNCVRDCACFHWRLPATKLPCQDLVSLPEGSAPGTSGPPVTEPQACCAPCSTRIEQSSCSRHQRVYRRSSTPVGGAAWRSWAHWPIWKGEAYLAMHWEEALSSFFFSS